MGRQEFGARKLNARFFVRILPSLDFCSDGIKIESDYKVIHVKCLQKSESSKRKEKPMYWCFAADDIFWNKSQEEVYREACGDLVENALNGVSAMVLAYGQTGSGKTFTVSGLRYHYENRGFVLRLLKELCEERDANRDLRSISVSVSYVEFLKTQTKDLLRNKLVDTFKDVKKSEIADEIHMWKVIFEAEIHRSFNETSPYAGSHRGHTVFTVHVESVSLIDSQPVPTCSKVHIVDMAGIDSLGNAPSLWRVPSDLGYSNLSKSLMEQLILCLSGKTWKSTGFRCPYKGMKLLEYLHDTLQPHCLVRFIGHIFGNEENLPLTLSILKFGEKLRGFRATKLQREFTENNPNQHLKILEDEVSRLRTEIELNKMLTDAPDYNNVSQEKLQEVRRAAKNFLFGKLEKLTLLGLGQAEITLEAFKELYERVTQEKEQAVKEAVVAAIEEVQAQWAPDRSFTSRPGSSTQVKASRRRASRQPDSQLSLTAPPPRSSDTSLAGSRKPSTASVQVGMLDRKGIALGPGKNGISFEGLVGKALKKVRSRKSDTVVRPGPRSSTVKDRAVMSVKDISAGDSQLALPEKIPTKEEAWHEFIVHKIDFVSRYQEEITRLEESARASRKNYVNSLSELKKHREALDKLRKEWEEWKHIRQVYDYAGEDGDEAEEDARDANTNKLYVEGVERREAELSAAIENCHVALIDFRNDAEELSDAKAALENEFEAFCAEFYGTVVAPEYGGPAHVPDGNSMESAGQEDVVHQARMDLYFQLQQKMIQYTPKRKKREWIARF